jgi:NAD(P)H-flavin reductase
MNNIYKPYLMNVVEVAKETYDTQTMKLQFQDEAVAKSFNFKAGQFGLYSAFGEGESTFCIASAPTKKGYIECTFRKSGRVTKALANAEVGNTIGFRGPYGNYFPVEQFAGRDIVFIAGGIGLAPIRSVIWNCLDLRDKFKNITIVYGARTVADLVYTRELPEWAKYPNVNLVKAVDPGGETIVRLPVKLQPTTPGSPSAVNDKGVLQPRIPSSNSLTFKLLEYNSLRSNCQSEVWDGKVGLVPKILEEANPDSRNAVALVCGPPIMIKFTLPVLDKLGFSPDNIYTTLENRMKCGIGKCGRCNVGKVYVCKEGPVFTARQLKELPAEY